MKPELVLACLASLNRIRPMTGETNPAPTLEQRAQHPQMPEPGVDVSKTRMMREVRSLLAP